MVVQHHVYCVASLVHHSVCLGKQLAGIFIELRAAGIQLYETPCSQG